MWLKAFGITILQLLFMGVLLSLTVGAVYLAYVSVVSTGGWAVLFVIVGIILYNMTKGNKKKLEDQRERAARTQ